MIPSSSQFSDVQNYWARPFIEALAQRRIVSGFPDGTFRPEQAVSRAQFATILGKAFQRPSKQQYVPFVDVPSTYWAASAIQKAYETGFLLGSSANRFLPEAQISRADVLVSLVNGLGIASNNTSATLAALPEIYQDAGQIPTYAKAKMAVATDTHLVVNHPNLKLLNPQLPATRAQVAVFIYQALVYLEQVPWLASDDIVFYQKTVSVSHEREFRGVWVATVGNIDWPSQPGLSVAQQQAELIKILDKMQPLNLNALILQVRPEGDALYSSKLEPWSAWLTGIQGKPPEPFYDPLEFAIRESHKRHIELHAWFNPYRAKVSTKNSSPPVSPHIAVTNPDVVYQWGNQLWMDPGAQVVQDRAYNVILDVVNRYDVDGIHLDDYFYPYPIEGQTFPDSKTYAAYQAGGGKLSLADWRRENVNQLIQRLAKGIKAAKPHVKFGISPFGIYRPGQPEQIRGLDAFNELYADSKKWLEQGWVDYLAPQLYWRIDAVAQSYPVLLKWWTQQNPKHRHIYPGNNLGALEENNWKLEEILKQVDITRNLKSSLTLGNIFFSMKAFTQNIQGIDNNFQTIIYAKPALVPPMQWLGTLTPNPPKVLGVKNHKLTWLAATNADIRSWTLYQQKAGTWTLVKVLGAETTTATVEPGTYALCAVDRLAHESLGVVIT